jgi:hypothetical protein
MTPHKHRFRKSEIYFINCFKMIYLISQYLWIAASLVFFLLGYVHLSSHFFGAKYFFREKNKNEEIENTTKTFSSVAFSIKPWPGFTVSHSIAAIYFGVINLILAGGYFVIIKESFFLMTISIAIALFYLNLAILYWPPKPRFCMWLANCFFLTALVTSFINL